MTPLPPKALLLIFCILSFLGFLDASYLTFEHYLGSVPACSFLEGCELVTTSPYATLEGTWAAFRGREPVFLVPRGISVALLGALYYGALFMAAAASWGRRDAIFLRLLPFTAVGLLAAAWFLSLQAFVLQAFCVYCIFSAATSTALFLVALALLQWKRRLPANI